MTRDTDDFYEDDEPVENIIAAFENAPKGLTKPPNVLANLIDATPDSAGLTATCQTCGFVLGPVYGWRGSSITAMCGCGTVLEAWTPL